MNITKEDIVHLRLLKSGLINPFSSIDECLSRLFGIQSQVQQFGELNIFNRVGRISRTDLEKKYVSNDIIKIWAQRMTVHMFSKNDWDKVSGVYSNRSNYVHKGWSDKKDLYNNIMSELNEFHKYDKFTKEDIIKLIEKYASYVDNPYRDYSIIVQATMDGTIFGIPNNPHTKYFAHRNKCIETQSEKSEKALEYVIKNYFQNYGPATVKDFCHWSGLTKSETEKSFENIKNDLMEVELDGKKLFLVKNDVCLESLGSKTGKAMMLGKFDPLFVSFFDKTWIADENQQKEIWRKAAIIEAVLLIDEKLKGTWRHVTKGKNISYNIFMLDKLSKEDKRKVEKEAEKVSVFFEKKLDKIEYV